MAQSVSPEVLDRLRVQERFECWNRGEFDMMLEPYAEDVVFDLSAVPASLKAGNYSAAITARSALGRVSRPVTLSFKIK